jgi:hypothetical protein
VADVWVGGAVTLGSFVVVTSVAVFWATCIPGAVGIVAAYALAYILAVAGGAISGIYNCLCAIGIWVLRRSWSEILYGY